MLSQNGCNAFRVVYVEYCAYDGFKHEHVAVMQMGENCTVCLFGQGLYGWVWFSQRQPALHSLAGNHRSLMRTMCDPVLRLLRSTVPVLPSGSMIGEPSLSMVVSGDVGM